MCKKLVLLVSFILVLNLFVGTAPVFSLPIITAIAERNIDTDATDTPAEIAVPLVDAALVFVDRTHEYEVVPLYMVGAEYVKTANDNKNHSAYELDVTISQLARIYVIVDNRMGTSDGGLGVAPDISGMPWLGTMGFVDTGDDIGIDESGDGDIDQYSSLFVNTFAAGTVTIHGNTQGHGGNMLGVAVLPPLYNPNASNPSPADGAINVPVDANLGWDRGDYALQDEVYFGTDPVMANLPQIAALSSLQPALVDFTQDLVASTTYYWYVVETDSNMPHVPGNPWSFTTVRGEAQPSTPADGSMILGQDYPFTPPYTHIYAVLDFIPGATAVSFTGYFSDDYAEVAGRVQDANLGSPPVPTKPNWYYVGMPLVPPAIESLVRGTVYYWTVDSKDALGNEFPGDIWEFSIQGYYAFAPDPPDEATFIETDVVLSWSEGAQVSEHDVYMGTSWEDVNNAVYNAMGQPPEFLATAVEPNYMATGLPPDTKLYWRVDEVYGRFLPGTGTYYKGSVWSFTTIPYFPITDPNLLVWWKFEKGSETAFDWSGHERHGAISGATWTSPGGAGSDYCLEFGGDGDYVDDDDAGAYLNGLNGITVAMWIKSDEVGTNSGFINGEWPDGGDNVVTMRYDSDGATFDGTNVMKMAITSTGGEQQVESSENIQTTDWQHVAMTWSSGQVIRFYVNGFEDTPTGASAATTGTVTGCSTLVIGKGSKDEDADQSWDGLIDDVQIYDYALSEDEIRNLAAPPTAWMPSPYDGEVGVVSPVTLKWMPGKHADKHDVYISTDKALVDARDASTYKGRFDPNTYGPLVLATGSLYYWAIDEVNDLGPDPGMWPGDTWIFRAAGGAGGLLGLYYHWDGILPPAVPGITDPGPANPFQIFVLSRIDPSVNFNWGAGSPDPNINVNNFACKWVGHVECPVDANYTFYTTTDDGARLFINDVQILPVAAWQQQGMTEWSGSVVLAAGLHDIEFHFEEGNGGAGAQLRWSAIPTNPSDEAITRRIIPPIWLWAPLFAAGPQPPHLSTIDERKPALEWIPGLYAATHELYFSANYDDVNDRNPLVRQILVNPYRPPAASPLQLARTYYWCVDEVKSVTERWDARSVWSFTIAECLSLDNFEDYNDRKQLRQVWTDGNANVVWGGTYPFLHLVQGGSSGSNLNVSSAVGTPVGGATGPVPPTPLNYEAMVLRYDNDGFTYTGLPGEEEWVYDAPYYSEIEADTVADLGVGTTWSSEGVKSLTLWFQGHPISDGWYDTDGPWPLYTQTGRGRDIEGRHDEFHFFSKFPLTTAGTVQVQVLAIEDTDDLAKAGVMIREKWTPHSRFAAVFMTPGSGVTFQWRENEDGPIDLRTKPGITLPEFVKLERTVSGSFIAKHSDNGSSWYDVNSTTAPEQPVINMDDDGDPNLYMGTAVSSHDALATCTANFNEVGLNPLPTNWVIGDIGTNDAEQLYVALSDGTTTAVVEHNDINAATLTEWQEWNILLTDFGGINLNNITKVYIGLGDRAVPVQGGSGAIYVDDFRACPPRCVAAYAKPLADIAVPYDCVVDEKDLRVLAGDWLESGIKVEDVWTTGSWSNMDIGDVCSPGSFTVLGPDTFEVSASGWDIWSTADEFHYAHKPLTGDGQITVRVVSILPDPSLNEWSKAGVMIRDTLDPNSAHAFIAVTPNYQPDGTGPQGHRVSAQGRLAAGDASFSTSSGNMTGPMCIRLIRKGDTFTTYYYYDGEWIELASTDIEMTDPVYIGMAVTAHNDSGPLATATFDRACSTTFLTTDFYDDFIINLKDYGVMTNSWLETILWP